MLKGKTVIELTDVKTGQKEIHEDTNMVTEAVADVLNTNIRGMLHGCCQSRRISWAASFCIKMKLMSVKITSMLH